MKRILSLLIIMLLIFDLSAQMLGTELLDSLKSKIATAPEDTNKVKLLGKLSFQYYSFDTDSGIHYGEIARALATKLQWGKGVAFSYNYIGTNYAVKGNYPEALENFYKALAEYTGINDQQGIAFISNNLGNFFRIRKEYTKAKEYLNKAIGINSALKNNLDLAKNYNNMGVVYFQTSEYAKSDSCYQKSLLLAHEGKDKKMVAGALINISEIRMKMNDVCGALELALKAANMSQELAIPYDGAVHNSYVGEIYLKIVSDGIENGSNCQYYSNNKKDNLLNARKYLIRSFDLLKSVNDQSLLSDNARLLSTVYEKLGDTKSALEYYKQYSTSKDSVDSKDNNLKLANIEKNREVVLRDNQINIQNFEIKQQHSRIRYQVVLFLLILMVVILFPYIYYKRVTALRLRASEEKYRTIFENFQDVFYQINLDGIILDVSPSVERFSEYTKEEVIGLPVHDFYADPKDRELLMEAILMKGELRDWELKFKTKSGEKFVSVSVSLILGIDGGPSYINGVLRDITERKFAESELKESKDKYQKDLIFLRSIFESPVDIIMFALDRNYCYTAFTQFHKKTIKMIWGVDIQIGMKMMDIISNEDDRKKAQFNFDRALRGDYFVETEEYGDDSLIRTFYENYYSAIKSQEGTIVGLSVFVIDVTHRMRAERQLKLLSRAIEQSPVTVLITDKRGIIEYVNPNFVSVSGYTMDEVKGQNPRLLNSGKQSNEFYQELWNTILSGRNWIGEMRNRKKNGDIYDESVIISPIINADGDISHFVAVKTDITEKNKMVEDLIKAKDRAEESDKLKSAFLNNISHEIRTPFNGILGFLPLLEGNDLETDERKEYIELINSSAHRLMNTINDIVEISRIQTGQIKLILSEVNIIKFGIQLTDSFKSEAENQGLNFTLSNHLPGNTTFLFTDSVKLFSILSNLIRNALKFTKAGSIEVEMSKNDDLLEFTVKDTGVGIPEDKQSSIFEIFMQVDVSNTRKFEGSGLGLSISKAYAEMLGGNISVKSLVGEGSVFCLAIPYPKHAEESNSVENSLFDEKAGRKMNSLKILIAEDDEQSTLLIEIVVRIFGNNIIKVSTGLEAVQACRDNPDIDLALMDIKMPGMDGYEAIRQIRQFNNKVVIIAQTAYALAGDREKAISAGSDDYITKPIRKDQLVGLIRKYFND